MFLFGYVNVLLQVYNGKLKIPNILYLINACLPFTEGFVSMPDAVLVLRVCGSSAWAPVEFLNIAY